jgi:predicted Zn finger-like uncharacterized protein
MPISVVCPGCKARFNVSDKFAGMKGACPKCKATITVPVPSNEEVKIHVPDQFASAGKDTKGRSLSKPIARVETKVKPVVAVGIAGAVLVTFVVAILLQGIDNKLPLLVVGLALISAPLAYAPYTFLRDQELEPYRGRELVVRVALCGLAYALLWAAYWPLPAYGIQSGEAWQWVFIAPVFISIGAAAAWATLDLDFGSAAMHYCFYVLVCLALRFALGMPPLWAVPAAST